MPLRGPAGLLKGVPLIGVAGTKVLGRRGVQSVQSTLPEAGGLVGEVPGAVSWDGDLGPLVAGVAQGSGVSLLPPLPSSLGPRGLTCMGICGAALLLGLRFAARGVRFSRAKKK